MRIVGFPMLMNLNKHSITFQVVFSGYMTRDDKQKYLCGEVHVLFRGIYQ